LELLVLSVGQTPPTWHSKFQDKISKRKVTTIFLSNFFIHAKILAVPGIEPGTIANCADYSAYRQGSPTSQELETEENILLRTFRGNEVEE